MWRRTETPLVALRSASAGLAPGAILLREGTLNMMQKIQKFGGAMFTPVLLFAFAGVVIGLGTLFTTEVIFGSLAATDSPWYMC